MKLKREALSALFLPVCSIENKRSKDDFQRRFLLYFVPSFKQADDAMRSLYNLCTLVLNYLMPNTADTAIRSSP